MHWFRFRMSEGTWACMTGGGEKKIEEEKGEKQEWGL